MTDKLSFFTPISLSAEIPKTMKLRTIESIDNYFYFGGRKAQIISQEINQDQSILYQYKMTGGTNADAPSSVLLALKVASYVTIILPLIALAIKAIARSLCQIVKAKPKSSQDSLVSALANTLSNEPQSAVLPAQEIVGSSGSVVNENFTQKHADSQDLDGQRERDRSSAGTMDSTSKAETLNPQQNSLVIPQNTQPTEQSDMLSTSSLKDFSPKAIPSAPSIKEKDSNIANADPSKPSAVIVKESLDINNTSQSTASSPKKIVKSRPPHKNIGRKTTKPLLSLSLDIKKLIQADLNKINHSSKISIFYYSNDPQYNQLLQEELIKNSNNSQMIYKMKNNWIAVYHESEQTRLQFFCKNEINNINMQNNICDLNHLHFYKKSYKKFSVIECSPRWI